MTQDDLCFTSAVDLAALIRNKDNSPVEVTVAFLSRIEQINAQLTAYVTVTADLLSKHADLLDTGMRSFTQTGRGITALDYLRTHQERAKLSQQLAIFFDTYDLLVSPTLAVPPFVIDTRPQEIGGQPAKPMGWNAFTYPFNLTGNPAASIPCGWIEDGLPIGFQIVGRRFADALVLQASAAFERAKPWPDQRPLIQ